MRQVFLSILMFSLFSCGNSTDEFIGEWKCKGSKDFTIQIESIGGKNVRLNLKYSSGYSINGTITDSNTIELEKNNWVVYLNEKTGELNYPGDDSSRYCGSIFTKIE